MTCNNCERGEGIESVNTTEVRSWTALPLLDVANIPEDLDLIGGSNTLYKSWRIPASVFMPGGTLNNLQHTFEEGLNIPSGQVIPVYTNHSATSVLQQADAYNNNYATALAVYSDGAKTITMSNGYYKFTRPHGYGIDLTYYLSPFNVGGVTSSRPGAGNVMRIGTAAVSSGTIVSSIDINKLQNKINSSYSAYLAKSITRMTITWNDSTSAYSIAITYNDSTTATIASATGTTVSTFTTLMTSLGLNTTAWAVSHASGTCVLAITSSVKVNSYAQPLFTVVDETTICVNVSLF